MGTIEDAFGEIKGSLQSLRSIELDLASSGDPAKNLGHREFIAESVFSRAFRDFERYIHSVFVAYCMGEQSGGGRIPVSYLKPLDQDHMERILRGHGLYVDWNDIDKIIQRAELYLDGGEPVKSAIVANRSVLTEAKIIRNHIAHNSSESLVRFRGVVTERLRTLPVPMLSAGEFLLTRDRANKPQIYLETYMDHLLKVSDALANCT